MAQGAERGPDEPCKARQATDDADDNGGAGVHPFAEQAAGHQTENAGHGMRNGATRLNAAAQLGWGQRLLDAACD